MIISWKRKRLFRRDAGEATEFTRPFAADYRTAILCAGFRETRRVRVFSKGWCDQVARYRPEVLAGLRDELFLAAIARYRVKQAVVLFRPRDREAGADRDLLWSAFGVPVFEQLLGPGNQLLASECEAHSGLHVVALWPGLVLDGSLCPCGNSSPRVVSTDFTAQLPS